MDIAPIRLFAPVALRLHADGAIAAEAPPSMAGSLDGWTIASSLVIFLAPGCGGKMDACQRALAVLDIRGGSS